MANDKCVPEIGPEVAGGLDQKRASALSGSGAAGVAHRMLWLAVALPWLAGAVAGEAFPPVPPGSGQITVEPELFADPAPLPTDPEHSFTGQRSPDGKLVLTASNGFFDHGMLAEGSPEAEFGSFGHEGSGVKLRSTWRPFDRYQEVTLALRAEETECGTKRRWFGYDLDHHTMRFRLYGAAAQRPHDQRSRLNLNPRSFVEQPGPPQRRRCGDRVRDVERRGWMLDENRNWHPVDHMNPGGRPGNIIAHHWSDAGNGWFLTGMGGMQSAPCQKAKFRLMTHSRWVGPRRPAQSIG